MSNRAEFFGLGRSERNGGRIEANVGQSVPAEPQTGKLSQDEMSRHPAGGFTALDEIEAFVRAREREAGH